MKFKECWYLLNAVPGLFRKLGCDKSWNTRKRDGYGHSFIATSRRHQVCHARYSIEYAFTDKWVHFAHPPVRPERDGRIRIEAPKICARCVRDGELERDHIIPLHRGVETKPATSSVSAPSVTTSSPPTSTRAETQGVEALFGAFVFPTGPRSRRHQPNKR